MIGSSYRSGQSYGRDSRRSCHLGSAYRSGQRYGRGSRRGCRLSSSCRSGRSHAMVDDVPGGFATLVAPVQVVRAMGIEDSDVFSLKE